MTAEVQPRQASSLSMKLGGVAGRCDASAGACMPVTHAGTVQASMISCLASTPRGACQAMQACMACKALGRAPASPQSSPSTQRCAVPHTRGSGAPSAHFELQNAAATAGTPWWAGRAGLLLLLVQQAAQLQQAARVQQACGLHCSSCSKPTDQSMCLVLDCLTACGTLAMKAEVSKTW